MQAAVCLLFLMFKLFCLLKITKQLEVYIGFSATPLEQFKPFLSTCAQFLLLDNALFEPDLVFLSTLRWLLPSLAFMCWDLTSLYYKSVI